MPSSVLLTIASSEDSTIAASKAAASGSDGLDLDTIGAAPGLARGGVEKGH
jgi:hypothetical protein